MQSILPGPLRLPPPPSDIRIAFISTYPPRRCGIGTYTKDLATSINTLNPERLAEIIALDDSISENLDYPWEVSHRIRQNEWDDYEKVLTYLNRSVIDMVSIQHEYGIFGGWDGDFIVKFAERLTKPYILTLHTILKEPTESQKKVIQDLSVRASAVVVMLSTAADILRHVYEIPAEKIVPIHHGAPDFPFEEESQAKKDLGLQDRIVMSSVNLISQGKGIEYAIQALPKVVEKYPNFLYLVVGQTHPVILEREGEKYRKSLERLVRKLKLTNNVQFVNSYVSLEELIDYVRASDFYITPYEGLEQISSGSLAYAIAAGKLCISTYYRYAQEMLAGQRGFLVPPCDPVSIQNALLAALENPAEAARMRQKCYAQGRKMIWERVGFRYVRLMEHMAVPVHEYPTPTLQYVRYLTDERGLLEHAHEKEKNFDEGYAVDDNARGLIVAIKYGDKRLAKHYLDFLMKAESNGAMHCDMDFHGKWVDTPGYGDWLGRAFWAACYAMQYAPTINLRTTAMELVRKLIPGCQRLTDLRSCAYVLLGLVRLADLEWDELVSEREKLLAQGISFIKKEFETHSDASWKWVEPLLHYDNSRIPEALLEVSRMYNRPDLQELGLELLDFVLDHTFDIRGNHFRFVGNKGWYEKNGVKANYDEQPIEAGVTVQACYAAYKITGIGYYRDMLFKAFAWFHGDNSLRRPLYNAKRGSVYDGITPDGVNANQGAESTLEYLLAYTCYARLVSEQKSTTLSKING